MTALVILSGALGLALGSFLNVLIVRLPAGESMLRPGSRCPSCGSPVRWVHNVPIASWLALRGRCASCHAGIGWQYPIVELATAAIWVGHAAVWGATPRALSGAVLLTFLLAIAIIDARHFLIPDELSLGGLTVGFLLSILPGPPSVPESAIGSVVGGGLLWIVAIVGSAALGREAMGGGDIKLMAMLGAFLGWQGALLTIFLGALLGTLVFLPIAWRSDRLVPFGVFLALGALAAFYFGDALLAWYFG
ncbi:MAG TPA: prepilin peptidase [Gemmatimonadota bacterium]|nr:prepilin peptidase [Gemmatimonadota bacterium]